MNAPIAPHRPVLRWHGGKWRLAPWIIAHFPRHRCYVEPFGGAASVLLRKERAAAEIYNDLDRSVVNLFRVLQDPTSANRLVELIALTPFSRDEFRLSNLPTEDPVEAARRLVIRSFMGFGSNAHNESGMTFRVNVREPSTGFRGTSSRTGFRSNSNGSNTTPAYDWMNYPDALRRVIERLRGVVIENRDAFKVMAQHDRPDALFYFDPPYLPETRKLNQKKAGTGFLAYAHDMTAADHARLIDAALALSGMVVLSGYPSRFYDERLGDWLRVEAGAYADGARPRTEVLWINPAAAASLAGDHGPLFANQVSDVRCQTSDDGAAGVLDSGGGSESRTRRSIRQQGFSPVEAGKE